MFIFLVFAAFAAVPGNRHQVSIGDEDLEIDQENQELVESQAEFEARMEGGYEKMIKDIPLVQKDVASKHSPFKLGEGGVMLGATTVALGTVPVNDAIQKTISEFKTLFPGHVKAQTVPHASIASLICDKPDVQSYNAFAKQKNGMFRRVKEYLKDVKAKDMLPRARIVEVKIYSSFLMAQLEEDPKQTEVRKGTSLQQTLAQCVGDSNATKILQDPKFFTPTGNSNNKEFKVTAFQKMRLDLCTLGAEIKQFWPADKIVIVNFVSNDINTATQEGRKQLWGKIYKLWKPLTDDKEPKPLGDIVMANYVERSLDMGSAVVSPDGNECRYLGGKKCYPVMQGVFYNDGQGNVLINDERYQELTSSEKKRAFNTWQTALAGAPSAAQTYDCGKCYVVHRLAGGELGCRTAGTHERASPNGLPCKGMSAYLVKDKGKQKHKCECLPGGELKLPGK